MALSKLDNLYMAVVADHSKHPHHHGFLEGVEQVQLNNPTCGDVISLSVKFDGNIISDIAFAGNGCTISTASSSMMTDAVIGKQKKKHCSLLMYSPKWFKAIKIQNKRNLGCRVSSWVSKFPQRIKCATLSWNALRKAIERDNQAEL